MAGFYRTEREALLFTQLFGIDPLTITPGLSTLNLWQELLQKLAVQGTVRATVKATRDQFPKNPRTPFLDALLADQPAFERGANLRPRARLRRFCPQAGSSTVLRRFNDAGGQGPKPHRNPN
jgi:hypothetical protein